MRIRRAARPRSTPRQRHSCVALRACAVRAPSPHPTPSASCHKMRKRASPVPAQRHAIDSVCVALEGAEFASPSPHPTPSASCQQDADTARRPSPLNATPLTESVWPWRVRSSRPLSTSHTFSVLSEEAETARRPSSLKPTPMTGLWPARCGVRAPSPHPTPSTSCQKMRIRRAARPRSTPRH